MLLSAALATKLEESALMLHLKLSLTAPKNRILKGFIYAQISQNIYHECTSWCETHWKGLPAPGPQYARNMNKMMMKYPVPMNCTVIMKSPKSCFDKRNALLHICYIFPFSFKFNQSLFNKFHNFTKQKYLT